MAAMIYTKYMKIHGTVFVVTGAGAGIGRSLALELLSRGANVAAIDLSAENLQTIKKEAAAQPKTLSTHTLDITDQAAVKRLPEAILKVHGSVDGIINCAGVIQPFVKINDLTYDAVERVMNVNFYGTLYMTKAFLPHLLERSEAYLANVSSMGGFLPVPGQGVYGASKAAVKLLTEALYAELLDTPVHVSTVFPGATKTDITKNSHVSVHDRAGQSDEQSSVKMLTPEQAATIIIDGIEKNKPQIFTGSDSRLMNKLYRLNPVFATKFIAKQMKSLLQ